MILQPVEIILILLWGSFFAYWWISALRNRTPLKRVPSRFGFLTTMGVPVGVLVLAASLVAPWIFASRLIPDFLPFVISGLLLVALGIGFAIWARMRLGRNWSSLPAIHENHTITRTGPYALVRHPIYTGILTGILGTGIATGATLVFFCLLAVFVMFLIKIRREEQFLTEEFGEEYERYRHEVKAIHPVCALSGQGQVTNIFLANGFQQHTFRREHQKRIGRPFLNCVKKISFRKRIPLITRSDENRGTRKK
jgi:protein-S-isoprenylcysteine O-methyltransferase Ste14